LLVAVTVPVEILNLWQFLEIGEVDRNEAIEVGKIIAALIQGRVTELLDMPALLQAFERSRASKMQQRQERVEV